MHGKRLTGFMLSMAICMVIHTGCSVSGIENENIVSNSEIVKYTDADPRIYLTDAEYFIDSELFNASWEEMLEIFSAEGEYDKSLFVDTVDGVQKNEFPMYRVADSITLPGIPVDCGDALYIKGEIDLNGTKKNSILSYDYQNREIKEIVPVQNEDMEQVYLSAGDDTLYWVESDCDYSQKDPEWSIFAMDTVTDIVIEIDSSENYESSAMLPMIYGYADRLAYIVGEGVGDTYNHYVQLYEKGNSKLIFNIRNVESPYMAPIVDSKSIYYPEYFEDGWYLLVYDLQEESITKFKMPFLTIGEFPNAFAVGDNQIIYHSELNIPYVCSMDTGDYKVLARIGGGIDESGLIRDKYLYTRSGDIYIYDLDTQTQELFFDREQFWCNGIKVANGKLYLSFLKIDDNTYYYMEY